MYGSCGEFGNARKVFDEMSERNLVSWSLIISGANKNSEYEVGMELFVNLVRNGCFAVNEFALGSVVKACVGTGDVEFGLCVHCFAVKIGLEGNVFVGSSVLHMYCKNGEIESAERLFESLSCADLGCWNAMVGGYAQCGYGLEATETVSSMHTKGVVMDEFTFIHALTACSITHNLDFGRQIHGLIVQNGFESTVTLMNSLIDMYAKSGAEYHAWKLFQTMEYKDVASWNTILALCSQDTNVEQVVTLFNDFMVTGLKPNRITFSILFRMCGDAVKLELGQQLYSLVFRLGLHNDPHVSTSLISMFCRCDSKESARLIFDSISSKKLENWNDMIHGYNLSSDIKGLKLFTNLRGLNIKPDECTFSCAVEACFRTENVQVGRQVHGMITKSGFASNGHICSSLVHGYAKFGFLTDAYAFFDDKMDIVCWGALISALVDQGYSDTAIGIFSHLKEDRIYPDNITLGSILNACASIASLNLTKYAHTHVLKLGFDTDDHVVSAVIDAYGKSGDLKTATIVFHESCKFADVALFNTMIMSFANHGCVKEAMEVYNMMKSANLKPSHSTFVSVLSACSHAGLVDLGRTLFISITLDYRMDPSPDNYGCLVDLLSRNGYLQEAKGVIEAMPFPAWPAVWRSFLNGCRIHGDKELGKMGAKKLVDLSPDDEAAGGYVLLSKIYSEDGNWEDGSKVRKEMVDKGIRKDLGSSWINA
ncbi:Pentatricopeptide repeat-containing protein (mitochondrion) [Artemisia annua]|uniref:Pentatricopeptide repeat-containing protein n=1 Tax=Artemisia annua TaxID=35608 RepID=A0A2U1PH09_ARTAN|nr:Pentatricopeptide repeat-containing protein [Artemisia annua]